MQKGLFVILSLIFALLPAGAQELSADSMRLLQPQMLPQLTGRTLAPQTFRALGELVVAGGIIHGVNRYAMNEPYAQSNLHTIRRNFRSGYIWDNDNFYTNELGHPYQGSIFFNTARSNGHNFWQSVPFALLGSLMWEYLGETEQPSINDIITTTVTGSLLGEVSHRMNRIFIDQRQRGVGRVVREGIAAVFNPVESAHRLMTGELWKVRNDGLTGPQPGEDLFTVSLGGRYLANKGHFSQGSWQPWVSFTVESGKTADDESHASPYDYFSLTTSFAFGHHQKIVTDMSITGRLCSTPLFTGKAVSSELGLFQYFYYNDTRLPGDVRGPFPFGEVVSFGPAFIVAAPHLSSRLSMEQRLSVRGIGLGTAESDYYDVGERQYNMGSGYGAHTLSRLTWSGCGSLQMKINYAHLYTWKGYGQHQQMPAEALSVMGDKSHTRLLTCHLLLRANILQQCCIAFDAAYYYRNTHYDYHPTHHTGSYEFRAGLEWQL